MTPVKIEPTAPWSQVKHWATALPIDLGYTFGYTFGLLLQQNLCKTVTLKKTENWFLRQVIATFIQLPFVIKIFVLSIFEWPFYTGFTVCFSDIEYHNKGADQAVWMGRLICTFVVWLQQRQRERSGSVVEPKGCGFEHHCIVFLSKNINPSLVLVQPRKTCLFITERSLMRRKESNQTNTTKTYIPVLWLK